MKTGYNLLLREFRLFFNNKVLLMLFLGAPILYGVLIGSVYQKGKVTHLPIIVVDEDRSALSEQLVGMFNESEVIYVAKLLPDAFQAQQEAAQREATVVVQIPKDFEVNINRNQLTELTLFVNASNTLTSNYASMAVNVCAATLKAGIQIKAQQKKGVPAYIASQQYEPFKTTLVKQHIKSGNYLYFMLPGVLFTVLQQVIMLALALSFASEFEKGTFANLLDKTSNVFVLISIKVLPFLLMSVGIYALYYGFANWYRMPISMDIMPFLGASMLFVLAVSFIGICVSVLIPSQLKATEILMVIATPSFILSGFTWPLSQMPAWVVSISNVIPLTHYLKIFRTLVIEQGDMQVVASSYWALALIAGLSLLLSVGSLYWKIRQLKGAVKAASTAEE